MTNDVASLIAANWQRVQAEVAAAVNSANRHPNSVRVLGVTKYVDAATTAALLDAGCVSLGENRPQVLWQKAESAEFADKQVDWHIIGHLQRNKVRRVLRHRPMIHSVDSPRIMAAIIEESLAAKIVTRVLLEVNISGDDSKTGMTASELERLLAEHDNPSVEICGLMAMAGWGTSGDVARNQFSAVRELRDQLATKTGQDLPELSMGMSGDFAEAIAEGATMVRIGSRLFEGIL